MRAIAVIPARGGSVGLPGKNIKSLNGIPLLSRSILAAQEAELVSKVYVSSDSAEILAVGESLDAVAIRRPDDISDSTASSESALIHALRHIEAAEGVLPDILVFLQCTSPFTTAEQIDEVIARLVEENVGSAFSATEDHGFIWEIAADGSASGITHDHSRPRQRRQDMTPRYRESGSIYAMRVPVFLAEKHRFCGRTVLVPTQTPLIEIDTPADWDIAEVFARIEDVKRKKKSGFVKIKALITDFDGVHTDDRVIVHQDGTESVRCSRSDGMGIEFLRNRGLGILILSREQNSVVRARANKLKIDVIHQVSDKLPTLDAWRLARELDWTEIAYIGNDINDLDCMQACGISFCPADSHAQIKNAATVVLERPGGHGALRELSEYLIDHQLLD